MPKVILEISYDIRPEQREEYLGLVNEMKTHFIQTRKKNYAVYVRGRLKRGSKTTRLLFGTTLR